MIASIYMALFSIWGILYMLYMNITSVWPYIVLSLPIFISEFVAAHYYNCHKVETARTNDRIRFLQRQLYDIIMYLDKNGVSSTKETQNGNKRAG